MTVIKSKLFHHNNLELQIVFDDIIEIYIINIHRKSDNSDFDMFGLYETLDLAIKKFNTISL